MYVTDYTSNGSSNLEPGTADGAMMVRPDMILKVLLWQNEASNEIMEKALDSVNSGSSILFKGLRVRHVNGALHANGRLNKPDFEIVVLRPDDLQSLALVQ